MPLAQHQGLLPMIDRTHAQQMDNEKSNVESPMYRKKFTWASQQKFIEHTTMRVRTPCIDHHYHLEAPTMLATCTLLLASIRLDHQHCLYLGKDFVRGVDLANHYLGGVILLGDFHNLSCHHLTLDLEADGPQIGHAIALEKLRHQAGSWHQWLKTLPKM